jgi:hypothetical protein
VRRAGSGPFRSIELRRCNEPRATCPFREQEDVAGAPDPGEPTFRCIRFAGHDSAADYLRTFATDSDLMMMFRRAFAEESHSVYRSSDHHVLEAMASKLAQRAFCLVVPLPFESQPLAEAPPLPAPVAAIPMTPSYAAPAPAAAAAEPEAGFADLLDQAQQAEALILAAQAGVPFCEECARRAAGAV